MKEWSLDDKRYMMGELCMSCAKKLRALDAAVSAMILEAALHSGSAWKCQVNSKQRITYWFSVEMSGEFRTIERSFIGAPDRKSTSNQWFNSNSWSSVSFQ